jgi:hypothetical protein
MSEKFGYHPSSFHKAAKRVGLTIVDNRGRNPEAPVKTKLSASQVLLKHHKTMTAHQIAEKFGFNYKHLMEVAKKINVKPIRRKKIREGKEFSVEEILRNNPGMTAKELAAKFGYHVSSFSRESRRLGLSISDGRKKKALEPKPRKTPPVMKNRPMPAAKPRKESNSRNPEKFKVKKVSYEGMRMLPVGIDNQYFYVSQDASEEEIAQERARRRERIEAKKQRDKISKF